MDGELCVIMVLMTGRHVLSVECSDTTGKSCLNPQRSESDFSLVKVTMRFSSYPSLTVLTGFSWSHGEILHVAARNRGSQSECVIQKQVKTENVMLCHDVVPKMCTRKILGTHLAFSIEITVKIPRVLSCLHQML